MNQWTKTALLCTCISFVGLTGSQAMAHMVFKKTISEAYPVMRVSCNGCHVDKKPKTVLNDFGKMFHKEMAAEKVTENWKAAKEDGGRTGQKTYEKDVMVPLFKEALKKIQQETVPEVEGVENPNAGKTWDEMISSEQVDGFEIDQRKLEKWKAEQAAAAAAGESTDEASVSDEAPATEEAPTEGAETEE